MSQTSIEIRPVSVTAVGISLGSLCGSLTFVIGAMWSVFAISWAIYDLANASKAADFALYASMAVAAPIAGYLALRMSERIKTQGLYTAWFATFTFGIIAISTFARSSISLFSLVAVYLMTASLTLFFRRTNDATRRGTFSHWIWIPNLAAAVSAACFLRSQPILLLAGSRRRPGGDAMGSGYRSSPGGCNRCNGCKSSRSCFQHATSRISAGTSKSKRRASLNYVRWQASWPD